MNAAYLRVIGSMEQLQELLARVSPRVALLSAMRVVAKQIIPYWKIPGKIECELEIFTDSVLPAEQWKNMFEWIAPIHQVTQEPDFLEIAHYSDPAHVDSLFCILQIPSALVAD